MSDNFDTLVFFSRMYILPVHMLLRVVSLVLMKRGSVIP
jgi:hypothetical protein